MTDLTQWARSLFSNISNSNVPVTDGGEAKLIRSSRTGSEEPTPSSKFPASDKTGKRGWATNTAIAADHPGRGSEGSGFVLDREATVRSHAPDTSPAPDFRYRPVTTGVRRRG